MVSGIKQFSMHGVVPFCNELPLYTIGPYFIAISGAVMSPYGYKKILMLAVDEKQVILL